jgi:hypothetical protein
MPLWTSAPRLLNQSCTFVGLGIGSRLQRRNGDVGSKRSSWTRELNTQRTILERTPNVVSALNSSLRRLTTILDASALVVSLDTGPLHIAAALGRPVVSLIGYSNPARYSPYPRIEDLIVNAYGESVEQRRVVSRSTAWPHAYHCRARRARSGGAVAHHVCAAPRMIAHDAGRARMTIVESSQGE